MPSAPTNLELFQVPKQERPLRPRQGGQPPPPPQEHKDSGTNRIIYTGMLARDLPTTGVEDFKNPEEVRRILRLHDEGDFSRSARLVDAMLTDGRIAGCLEARIAGLQALNFEMKPAGGLRPNRKQQEAIAARALEFWDESFPLEDRVSLLEWGYLLGVGIGQLIWDMNAKEWTPKQLEVWHPSAVRWRWDTRSYWVQTLNQGLVEVDPGNGQWVLFTPYGFKNGWRRALLKRLSVSFCGRLFGTRDLLRSSEVNGNPSRVGRFPRGKPQAEVQGFINGLAALATDTVVAMPVDDGGGQPIDTVPQYAAELLEAKGRPHEVFKVLLERMDVDIAIAILGQNLTTEVKGGSHAAAAVHQNVRADIIKRDARQSVSLFRKQCLRPWVIPNYGDGALTPIPEWDTLPPEDKAKRAETLEKVGKAVGALRLEAGWDVDDEAIADEFNIPLRRGEDGQHQRIPGEMLPEDLTNETVQRDERRRRLGLPPMGGKRGKELLKDAAAAVAVPPEAKKKQGEAAKGTLLTLLSLRGSALEQLVSAHPAELKGEARWFARRYDVRPWRATAQRELARRRGEVATLSSAEQPTPGLSPEMSDALGFTDEVVERFTAEGSGAMRPLLGRIVQEVEASTSYEDLKQRLVGLVESAELNLTEEQLADMLMDVQGLGRLMGNASVLEELESTPEN